MVFTERIAIREELEFIREERRKLTDRYHTLVFRLRELDEEDRKVGSFADNEGVMNLLQGLTKELSYAVSRVHSQAPMTQYLEEQVQDQLIQKDNVVIDKETVVDQKEQDRVVKKGKGNDLRKTALIVLNYLKDAGGPVKSSRIFDYLRERHNLSWDKRSQGYVIKTLVQYEKKIVNSNRGYYQYKF